MTDPSPKLWVLTEEVFLESLDRAFNGELPDLIMVELLANAEARTGPLPWQHDD